MALGLMAQGRTADRTNGDGPGNSARIRVPKCERC